MPEETKDRLSVTFAVTPQNLSLQTDTNAPPAVSDFPDENSESSGPLPFQVVAVAASAGGLDAYLELLASLPAERAMAFAFVPHLSPPHKSHLVEILSRHTAMGVMQTADGMPCEPNHAYVLPRNARAVLSGGRRGLQPRLEGDRIPQEAAIALYRIAQEPRRNVAKHAGKTHVRPMLTATEGAVRLTIKDLGHGFDGRERASSGLGLLSMEERARLVEGTLRLHSETSAGTSFEMEVPLPSE
jgi:hypothetical protein